MTTLVLEVLALFLFPTATQEATIPREVATPYPTITSASVEWRIQGDDNLNGRVVVQLTVNGTVDLLGAEEVAIRHCSVNAQHGIVAARPPGCKNCYIADNIVTYIMPWVPEGMGSGSIWGGPRGRGRRRRNPVAERE